MKSDWLYIIFVVLAVVAIFFSGFGTGKMCDAWNNSKPEPPRFIYLETLSDEMQDGTMMYGICRYDRQRGHIETITVYSLDAFRRVMKELEVR